MDEDDVDTLSVSDLKRELRSAREDLSSAKAECRKKNRILFFGSVIVMTITGLLADIRMKEERQKAQNNNAPGLVQPKPEDFEKVPDAPMMVPIRIFPPGGNGEGNKWVPLPREEVEVPKFMPKARVDAEDLPAVDKE